MVDENVSLDGKIAIVTGSNRGIGYEVARDLCRRQANVIMACRSEDKANMAIAKIKETQADAKVQFVRLDLASFESIRAFTREVKDKYERLDILVNNAGVMGNSRRETSEGFELHFGVNYLGHFLLTHLLLDLIKKGNGDKRIVNLTSRFHRKKLGAKIYWDDLNLESNFHYLKAYCQSKLMLVMFTCHLADALSKDGISVMVVDPGIVRTDLTAQYYTMSGCTGLYYNLFWRPYIRYRAKSATRAAQSVILCVVTKNPETFIGKLVKNCQIIPACPSATSPESAEILCSVTKDVISQKCGNLLD